ncbi:MULTISPECIES: DotU family type IV/VI secretion system protein [Polyangium]|uniref:DotU family type IV/VI secretion system protein n=2 Tax=Polyangium TaxID=55 RepID=A0A6N7PM30_9BACT|nr:MULTISPECIES: DotU family type IV/VI secretion system protein [Polyangium]MDC3956526.1 DotU family type IV/VI secretion system protein [Polyangium jinanense]MDC3985557.1 DotU family type IV/VI secretion system protein [Polyangium jinanense]MDI1476161.1 DotU family type IV/VI secretion system protein [Polyangium sp. y55x31]MRG91320.1 DotU family type IV/VI secretion system protein [Polyangium spumosum]
MSLSQSMYWVCSDVLSLILQLRNSRDLPAPDILQRRVLQLFDTMMQNGREARIPEQDMIDAKFALAAFADEVIYHSSWPGKTQWLSNPLQLQFFQLNTAGDQFFVNLDNLHGQRNRAHVAQIYFLCLALGFQGKYRLRHQEGLQAVVEGLGNYVALAEGGGDQLAPNAERKDGGGGAVRRELPYLFIAIGFLILALIVIFILWLIIGSNADSTAEAIKKLLGGGK